MSDAYVIYSQDVNEKFNFEHAWRLLKEEPKWKSDNSDSSCKRSKISNTGQYSTSSNTDAQTDEVEYDPANTVSRPIGQKAAKRKNKQKVAESSNDAVDVITLTNAMKEKTDAMKRMAEAKETTNYNKWYEILMKDTSGMTPKQLETHQKFCDFVNRKLGL